MPAPTPPYMRFYVEAYCRATLSMTFEEQGVYMRLLCTLWTYGGSSRTWKVAFYPKGRKSIKAAGLIYPDMPKVIRAFTSGEPIRTKHGSFLAVPTPAAPKKGVGGKRISPSNFPEHSLGKLVFVYRPRGVSLLVVENLKAGSTGKFRKAPDSARRSGRGLTTVVMFFLVPQVRLRKRLDLATVADKHTPDLPQAILDAWPEQKDGK